MRTVVITCTAGAYEGKIAGEEIWSATTSFMKPTYQKGIDRLYLMDRISDFTEKYPDFISQVNDLDCMVYCLRHYREIPKSRRYPIEQIIKLGGYFTSSISYMIAHAIYEEVDKIVLYKVNSIVGSQEYLHQKDCHDFWCGFAKGRGIEVVTTDSFLLQPHPWCAPIYGYTKRQYEDVANKRIRQRLQEVSRLDGKVIILEGNAHDLAIHV